MSEESTIRMFVSIDVDDPTVLSKIGAITSDLLKTGGDLKLVEPENIHLTLKFLGNVASSRITEVQSSLDTLRFSPTGMEIAGTGAFPSLTRMNVIWVGVSKGWTEIEQIYDQTEKIFSPLGFPRENRPFSPHITIARVRSNRKNKEMAEVLVKHRDQSFGSIQFQKVCLKQSVLSSRGPKYSTLYVVTGKA